MYTINPGESVMNDEKLTANQEEYLVTIYKLEKKNRVARVSDISNIMKVKMSSVVSALKILNKKKLVIYEKKAYITMTGKGQKIARVLCEKFIIIREFLEKTLEINSDDAVKQACKIEHFIDTETAKRLCRFTALINTLSSNPEFHNYLQITNKGPCANDNCQRRKNLTAV